MEFLLDAPWHLSFEHPQTHEKYRIPARVPGNAYAELVRGGIMPDPYMAANSELFRIWEFADWTYETCFDRPEFPEGELLWLCFDGIDTIAEIRLNGKVIGSADNMFIPWRYELDPSALLAHGNRLGVLIRSPLNYARKYRRPMYSAAQLYNYEGLYLRRPIYTYGWDIAPRLVGAGLWRKVFLKSVPRTHWDELAVTVLVATEMAAKLTVNWTFSTPSPVLDVFEMRIRMELGTRIIRKTVRMHYTTGMCYLDFADPALWWPAGSGSQPLYDMEIELVHDGAVQDIWKKRIGVRRINLIRDEALDEGYRGNFAFEVNDRKIFIKGANWIPADALAGEEQERVRENLELFRELNCNMVRVWGGGVYEDECFYDYCDEHGLLVWQDFMFACEVAPSDEEFMNRVKFEAESIIRELRHHACLALWCGNNECDNYFMSSSAMKKFPPSVNRISREILCHAVAAHDPSRDYLPASPYYSDAVWKVRDPNRAPEQHLWGERGYWKGDYYRNNTAVFVSEFGYLGMCSTESLHRFLPQEGFPPDPDNHAWLIHASQPFGDPAPDGPFAFRLKLLETEVTAFWGTVPESLDDFIEASQVVQAEALKFMVEQFRMKKWRKTGILWWNMRDCWPQVSDAVVDYYGDRKRAFYTLKTAQQPLLMMIGEPDREKGGNPICCSNDSQEPRPVKYRIFDLFSGEEFKRGSFDIPADSVLTVGELEPTEEDRLFILEWEWEGRKMRNHFFRVNPPFPFNRYCRIKKEFDTLMIICME